MKHDVSSSTARTAIAPPLIYGFENHGTSPLPDRAVLADKSRPVQVPGAAKRFHLWLREPGSRRAVYETVPVISISPPDEVTGHLKIGNGRSLTPDTDESTRISADDLLMTNLALRIAKKTCKLWVFAVKNVISKFQRKWHLADSGICGPRKRNSILADSYGVKKDLVFGRCQI
jgi:hypothetical protein